MVISMKDKMDQKDVLIQAERLRSEYEKRFREATESIDRMVKARDAYIEMAEANGLPVILM